MPETRKLFKHLLQYLGQGQRNPTLLYQLILHGYGQQACKIANMRKPFKLMQDF